MDSQLNNQEAYAVFLAIYSVNRIAALVFILTPINNLCKTIKLIPSCINCTEKYYYPTLDGCKKCQIKDCLYCYEGNDEFNLTERIIQDRLIIPSN